MSSPEYLRGQLARLVDEAPVAPDRLARVRRRATVIRRRRGGSVVSAAATAVVALTVAVTTVSASSSNDLAHPPTTTAFPATKVPTSILLADLQGRIFRLGDLASTTATQLRGPRIQVSDTLHAAVGTASDGRTIIAWSAARDLVAIDPAHPEGFRPLLAQKREHGGEPAGYDVPGVGRRNTVLPYLARGGTLWLWAAQLPSDPEGPVPHSQLVPVDLNGNPIGSPITLPELQSVIAVGRKGAYVSVPASGDHLRLVRVDAASRLHRVGGVEAPLPDQGGYGAALWNGSTECTGGTDAGRISSDACRHDVLDAEAGRVTVVTGRPSEGFLFEDREVFSPDGRYAAVELGGLPLASSGNQLPQGWAVVDLLSGASTVIEPSVHLAPSVPDATVVWSGDRLIWTGTPPDGRGTIVGAYLPATGRSMTTRVATRGLRALGAGG
ncbi:MAG: hypothetical protein ACJ74O_18915 [Frankiaceae bacterium]